MRTKTLFIARASIIAGLYVVLTLLVAPFAYGPVQFRISEALTILPLFYLESIPALAVGCFLANLFSGYAIDMVLGTLATLVAAICTRVLRKVYLGIWPPIIINALVVPVIIILSGDAWSLYFTYAWSIAIGQFVACGLLGTGLYFALNPVVKRVSVMRPITLAQLKGVENPVQDSKAE